MSQSAPIDLPLTASPAEDAPATMPASGSVRFLLRHAAHLIALGFGSGLSPLAPGTVGTLWGWLSYGAMQLWLSPSQIGWVIAASLLLGWWACTATARHLKVADPGCIVWDEIVAFWLILWVFMPASFWGQLAAFAVFRYFDAAKPGPVAWADRQFKGLGWRGGFGILWDDLVAAACTLLVLALGVSVLAGWSR
ncbi:MAG: phosphatidylglycerophosphatase A [Burkholderiaceae bacterium]